jgi:hypothetical protein
MYLCGLVLQGYLVQVKSALDRQQLVLSAEFDDGSARRVMVLSAQVLYRAAHQTRQQRVLYALVQEGGGPARAEQNRLLARGRHY